MKCVRISCQCRLSSDQLFLCLCRITFFTQWSYTQSRGFIAHTHKQLPEYSAQSEWKFPEKGEIGDGGTKVIGKLGHPLPLFQLYQSVTAPWLITSRGATDGNTTTSNHRPQRTRVYYHTTVLQPSYCEQGTTRIGTDNEERRREKEGAREEKKITQLHTFVYPYICDWRSHDHTINNHYRNSQLSSKTYFPSTNTGIWGHVRIDMG